MNNVSTTLAEKISEKQEYEMMAQEDVPMEPDYRIMLECKCQTEFMAFEENVYKNGEVEILATFYHGSLSIKSTFKQKLYSAYCVMRYGRAMMYDFIFGPEDMFRLRDWLNEKYPADKTGKK